MTHPIQAYCVDCDECFGPDQLAQNCPHCDTELIDHEEALQAAWERQQEDWASEPPISADERHQQAWVEKQMAKGRGMFL